MQSPVTLYYNFHDWLFKKLRHLSGVPILLMRLYLGPIFILAGLNKYANFEDIVNWFGNTEWGLGLPAPELMAYLATYTEIIGGWALVLGFGVRWVSIPLMITMAVAAYTSHWENGWNAIASSSANTHVSHFWAWLGFADANANQVAAEEVASRVSKARELLDTHGNSSWLNAKGNFVILQNGIEFAATYFIMCFALLFSGGGKYFSVDFWLNRFFTRHKTELSY